MKFEYSTKKFAQKALKTVKRLYITYIIMIILLTIDFLIFVVSDEIKLEALFIFIMIYWFIGFGLMIIFSKWINKTNWKTMAINLDPYAYLNINIFMKKIFLNKKVKKYAVHNIAYAYLMMGEIQKAEEALDDLNIQEVDDKLKSYIMLRRVQINLFKNHIETFKKDATELKNSINNMKISEKIKHQIMESIELDEAVINNNEEKVIEIATKMQEQKIMLYQVIGEYYKGLIYEKNNKEQYKEHYQFVAENGNELYRAKKVREKINVNPKNKNTKIKTTGISILFGIILCILVVVFAFLVDYVYEKTQITWDTGNVEIVGKEIQLPCKVTDFETYFGININEDEVDENKFVEVYLDSEETDLNADWVIKTGKKINLYIEDGYITGINVDISNVWNRDLDEELGEMVIFPENITANSAIQEIQESYKTGIINYFMRDWEENIPDGDETLYSYGINYSGEKYNLTVDTLNGKVQSIFYYKN